MKEQVDVGEPFRPSSSGLRWVWWCALGCFVLAGLTGAFFRFGVSTGATWGLSLGNVRHAHSHLMYFGWVTPVLMALISCYVPVVAGRSLGPGVRWILASVFGAALVAYPLFLAFGYTPVVLGQSRLPLSVIAASLNMLVWYVFVVRYAKATRGVERGRALLLWDAALTFLVLATGGAWGVALLKPLGIESVRWTTALTHIFLDYFAEGWFVLAVLGLIYAALGKAGRRAGHWSLWLILAGLPLTFALGMMPSLVPPALRLAASVGSVLMAVGLLVQAGLLFRAIPRGALRWMWGIPLGLLAAKALAQGLVGAWPNVAWASLHGLRILYLHAMLLGFVTLGVVVVARDVWGRAVVPGVGWMYGAVLLLLASLLPLTTLWPAAWRGWVLDLAAWTALLPPLVVIGWLMVGLRPHREAVPRR